MGAIGTTFTMSSFCPTATGINNNSSSNGKQSSSFSSSFLKTAAQ
jgi:hypothetical protein